MSSPVSSQFGNIGYYPMYQVYSPMYSPGYPTLDFPAQQSQNDWSQTDNGSMYFPAQQSQTDNGPSPRASPSPTVSGSKVNSRASSSPTVSGSKVSSRASSPLHDPSQPDSGSRVSPTPDSRSLNSSPKHICSNIAGWPFISPPGWPQSGRRCMWCD